MNVYKKSLFSKALKGKFIPQYFLERNKENNDNYRLPNYSSGLPYSYKNKIRKVLKKNSEVIFKTFYLRMMVFFLFFFHVYNSYSFRYLFASLSVIKLDIGNNYAVQRIIKGSNKF